MAILLWVILGALAGWIVSFILGGHDNLFANVVVGIIGAVTGGIVLNVFGATTSSSSGSGLLTAVLGAVILLAIVKNAQRPTV